MRKYFAPLLVGLVVVALSIVVVPHIVSAVDLLEPACSQGGGSSSVCQGNQDSITGTDGIILRAAELLSIVAGIAAVVGIMIAGIIFITAGGDSGKITSAKNTITYCIVGLVFIFLARAIVVFVIDAL